MRVLALVSLKGGSGKTTLAAHLAVQADEAGAGPLVLMDTDTHGSLTDWWDARGDDRIDMAQTNLARLGADIDAFRRQGYRLAMIDTPPANPVVLQSALQNADLAVIPVRPGPQDLRAVGATIDICERAGKPIAFVINAAAAPQHRLDDVAAALAPFGTVMPNHLPYCAAMADAMAMGGTILEAAPDDAAAQALPLLWDQLCQRAEKNFRRTVFSAGAPLGAPHPARLNAPAFGRRIAG